MFRASRGCQNSRLEPANPWISLIATTLLVAFSIEKAVTDAVAAADATVLMKYDNVAFTTPGKTKKYILMTISLLFSFLEN